MKQWYRVLLSSRPISWINTAYPFVIGCYAALHGVHPILVIGGLFFLIPYNLLMYGINDVFDYESDLKNPRKGGVEGAVLELSEHRRVLMSATIVPLPFIIYLLAVGPFKASLFFIYLLAMVVAYSAPKLRFKERPFLDSFTSATHFVSPLVYGLLLGDWHSHYWLYIVAFFLWGMASHAFGAVQDILADRAGNIASIGTSLGASWTTRFAVICYLGATILLVLSGQHAWAVAFCGLLYIGSIVPYSSLADKAAEKAHAGWQRFLWLNYVTGAVVTISLLYVVHYH